VEPDRGQPRLGEPFPQAAKVPTASAQDDQGQLRGEESRLVGSLVVDYLKAPEVTFSLTAEPEQGVGGGVQRLSRLQPLVECNDDLRYLCIPLHPSLLGLSDDDW
jgi:hypothetical protein